MQGYPKHLNTKTDYIYVKDNFPREEWAKDWQALLDSRKNWFFVATLADEKDGVTDETHKVVKNDDGENVTYSQYELRDDETADIYRLGFTVEEVQAALA